MRELYIILDHYNKRGLLCYCQHLACMGILLMKGHRNTPVQASQPRH